MPKTRQLAASLAASPHDVEAAFYEALQAGDIEQLMACWADEDDILCIHPGGPRIVGAAAIRAAFEAMFAHGTVQAEPQHVRTLDALTASVHSVLERVRLMTDEGPHEQWVVATNVYHKGAQGWRLVAHHASPGRAEVAEVSTTVRQLH